MPKPLATEFPCVQCAHAGVVCLRSRRTNKCARCIERKHDCSFKYDLHAEDVDVYLPEIINSVEEILGRHDATLVAILESYEDLMRSVDLLLREVRRMRAGMPSSGTALSTTMGGSSGAEEDGGGDLSGVVPDDETENDGLATVARSSLEQARRLVASTAALEEDDERFDRESRDKAASPKSKPSTVKRFTSEPEFENEDSGPSSDLARKNDIAAGEDSSRFSSPKITSPFKRRSSRRVPIVESDAEEAGENDNDVEGGRRLRDRTTKLEATKPKRRSPPVSEYSPSSPDATIKKGDQGHRSRAVGSTRASSSGANRSQVNANKGPKAGSSNKSQAHVGDTPVPSSSKTAAKAHRGGSEGGDESGKLVLPAKRKRSPFSETRLQKFGLMKKLKEMDQARGDSGKK